MNTGLWQGIGRIFSVALLSSGLVLLAACTTSPPSQETQAGEAPQQTGKVQAKQGKSAQGMPAPSVDNDGMQSSMRGCGGDYPDEDDDDDDEMTAHKAQKSKKSEFKGSKEKVWREFYRTAMNQMSVFFVEYLKSLQALGWEDALEPESLARDRNLQHTRKLLAQTGRLNKEYIKKIDQELMRIEKSIETVDMDSTSRQYVREEFNKTMKRVRPFIKSVSNFSEFALKQADLMAKLMASRPGEWKAMPNLKVVFKRPEDQKKFDAYRESVEREARIIGEKAEKALK